MLKVKILSTGEVITVTPNVAHGLIDAGKAEAVVATAVVKPKRKYKPRKMREGKPSYDSRQMRVAPTNGRRKKQRQKITGGYKGK